MSAQYPSSVFSSGYLFEHIQGRSIYSVQGWLPFVVSFVGTAAERMVCWATPTGIYTPPQPSSPLNEKKTHTQTHTLTHAHTFNTTPP